MKKFCYLIINLSLFSIVSTSTKEIDASCKLNVCWNYKRKQHPLVIPEKFSDSKIYSAINETSKDPITMSKKDLPEFKIKQERKEFSSIEKSAKQESASAEKIIVSKITEKPIEKKIRSKQKPITISNLIDLESVTYKKHWYKPSPSSCIISINNQEIISIKEGQEPKIDKKCSIEAQEKIVKISYHWEIEKFGKMWHKEVRDVLFELLPNAKGEYSLSFDWETPERLCLTNAKILSHKTITL